MPRFMFFSGVGLGFYFFIIIIMIFFLLFFFFLLRVYMCVVGRKKGGLGGCGGVEPRARNPIIYK